MPRRSGWTTKGRQRLRGKSARARKSPRGLKPKFKVVRPAITLGNGKKLNRDETEVYYAMQKMGIYFIAQAQLGGVGSKGSALVDFLLPNHKIALEYQGYFHNLARGEAQDFLRRLARKKAGYDTVYLYPRDLGKNLFRRLKEVISFPQRAIIETKGAN
jgi:very-short-patch-repair endonuclease